LLAVAPDAQTPAPVDALSQPLTATAHPPIPRDPFELWLAPTEPGRRSGPAVSRFRTGVKLHAEARYQDALPLVSVTLNDSTLADYALFYTGVTQLRLSQLDAANATFAKLLARPLKGYLSQAARLHAAETAEARGDHRRAASTYKKLAGERSLNPPDVLLRLARASHAAGDTSAAAMAWARVYYEFPLSPEAALAQQELATRELWQPLTPGSTRYEFELGRAERLFGSRRYADARTAFAALAPLASGDEKELVHLRIAESDHYMRRYAAARTALEPYTRRASRKAEAQFFYLTATRELGEHNEFVRLSRELVAAWPEESWAEETLNNLATHFIKVNEDARAAGVFSELLSRFPDSRHAPRAAWKAGWWAYKQGRYDETVRTFEAAAARFPRSDYRPSWLYWSARSYDRLKDRDTAHARYRLVVTDYANSYYGRLATRLLEERRVPVSIGRTDAVQAALTVDTTPLPPTEGLIRALIAHELYDDAMRELQYAQLAWGDSAAIQATMGLVYKRQGELRRGINAMKRAYPQYIASGGERLPDDLRHVLFPVAYWDLIRKHAGARGLDPYLIAALMAQESTFDPEIRSSANAVGLMQIVPRTGRQYARRIGIRRFRPSMLTNPDINVRLGTTIFADLSKKFGGAHFALASYNAGETPVRRWIAERPGVDRDEFIDDIPYPETQNYVKKIVGTAEDYRRLYGEGSSAAPAVSKPARKAPAKKPSRPVSKPRPRR
jgi:soluble lytic murein transglycosylase